MKINNMHSCENKIIKTFIREPVQAYNTDMRQRCDFLNNTRYILKFNRVIGNIKKNKYGYVSNEVYL